MEPTVAGAAGPVRYTLLSTVCPVRVAEITPPVCGKEDVRLRLAEAAVAEPGSTLGKVILYPTSTLVAAASTLPGPRTAPDTQTPAHWDVLKVIPPTSEWQAPPATFTENTQHCLGALVGWPGGISPRFPQIPA